MPFLFSQNVSLDFAAHISGVGIQSGSAIAVDHEGNILSTGNFSGTADFDPGSGVHNLSAPDAFYVLKLDDQGDFLWAHCFGKTNASHVGNDITVDHQGNVYVTGLAPYGTDFDPGPDTFLIDGPISFNHTSFILKLSSSGDLIWARQVGYIFGCHANSIEVDLEGNVNVAGRFWGPVDFNPGPDTFMLEADNTQGHADAFVLKLDSAGAFMWARQIGGPGGEEIRDLKLDDEAHIHLTGSFSQSTDFDPGPNQFNLTAQGFDAFVCQLDADGQFVWAKPFGSTGPVAGDAIALGTDGQISLSCWFRGQMDADPGPDSAFFMTTELSNSLIIQLDSSGNLEWASQLESTSFNRCSGLSVDEAGNIYGTGGFTGITDFDPGALSYELSAENGDARFLLKLDSQGQLVWANANIASGGDIYLNPAGDIFSIGSFTGTLDVDPGPAVNLIMSPDSLDSDFFIIKLKQITTGIEDELERENFTVFPNPTSDVLTADIQSNIEEIAVFDVQGRLVHQNAQFPLSLASLESGVYVIRVRTKESEYILKFIKK